MRIQLTQAMALGIDCTQTGSHVIELSQQLAAARPCDAHPLSCADPTVLPFGCGVRHPRPAAGHLQRHRRGLPVGDRGHRLDHVRRAAARSSARSATTASTTTATASRLRRSQVRDLARVREVRLPPRQGRWACCRSTARCSPASSQTATAGDDQTTRRASSAPGGQDGDVDFQVPAKADVTREWAQVGNHDFALYDDEGTLLACEAATSFGLRQLRRRGDRDARLPALPRAATTWSSTPTSPAPRAASCSSSPRSRAHERDGYARPSPTRRASISRGDGAGDRRGAGDRAWLRDRARAGRRRRRARVARRRVGRRRASCCDLIASLGRRALPLQMDVTRREQIAAATAHAVRALGRIDVLVNNAGIGPPNPAEAVTEDDFDRTVARQPQGDVLREPGGRRRR